LSLAARRRRQMGEESEAAAETPLEPDDPNGENGGDESAISEETYADLAQREEFVAERDPERLRRQNLGL